MLPKRIALICGGPSPERGISLNSARSVMDHLMDRMDIVPFYVDLQKNFYRLDPALLYSNTPSDFDFKLTAATELSSPRKRGSISSEDDNGGSKSVKLSTEELIKILKTFDLVFPVIHGHFGETGELQAFLEQHDVPFVGCSSETCRNMYYKDRASAVLKQAGFDTLPSVTVKPSVILDKATLGALDRGPIDYIQSEMFENMIKRSSSIIGNGSSVCSAAHPRSSRGQALAEDDRDYINDIHAFFIQHNITRAIVKPIAGGSSIGVHSVTSAEQAIDIVSKATMPMLIEPFCEGREFTVIVLENSDKEPVALVPTEIQISYKGGAIFDYRRKYLPTSNTSWACPPNFPDAVIQKIRVDAEAIFRLFNMRDFARLDGWVLHDGRILFTDMNPISGMEQNSFIFQQTSRIGMTHQEALLYVLAP